MPRAEPPVWRRPAAGWLGRPRPGAVSVGGVTFCLYWPSARSPVLPLLRQPRWADAPLFLNYRHPYLNLKLTYQYFECQADSPPFLKPACARPTLPLTSPFHSYRAASTPSHQARTRATRPRPSAVAARARSHRYRYEEGRVCELPPTGSKALKGPTWLRSLAPVTEHTEQSSL